MDLLNRFCVRVLIFLVNMLLLGIILGVNFKSKELKIGLEAEKLGFLLVIERLQL